ncbi:MAG: hypothetical protein IJJ38_03220 [Lachnospiraceae bacterium]|nr:hypothetical protein [Lachnospiraceae bacterium]
MGVVLIWWFVMLLAGAACLPLTGYIFRKFRDGGWLFSKMLGLFLAAWILWAFNCLGLLLFLRENAAMVCLALAIANYGGYLLFMRYVRQRRADAFENAAVSGSIRRDGRRDLFDRLYAGRWLILFEEAAFFLLFALSVYVVGFKPDAYGTEKFMDYGFITSMMRSLTMPFADMWYSGKAVNYYYGGQYITAFLVKLTGVTAGEGYNLMRALVTTASFLLPFSLVYQLLADSRVVRRRITGRGLGRLRPPAAQESSAAAADPDETDACAAADPDETDICAAADPDETDICPADASALPDPPEEKAGKRSGEERQKAEKIERIPLLGGLLGGCAVAFCGNFHYVIYGIILPIVNKIRGISYTYWFPDSTRYIGYDPDLPDKTIHEFPSYSSVLGDLHAHYLNILFVVTVTAVVYGWAQKRRERAVWNSPVMECAGTVLCPEVLLTGFMTGAFRWTNFWDFPIYYVVTGSIFFFVLLGEWRKKLPLFAVTILLIAAVMFGAGVIGGLPFTATFFQISSEIGVTSSHTLLHQLAILWGLPFAVLIGYVISLIREKEPHLDLPDLCVLMFGLCAAGLVFLPEVIYVKDIYSGEHYRANTMFKLTYQAFILFGMCMAYILTRELAKGRTVGRKGGVSGSAAEGWAGTAGDSSSPVTAEAGTAGARKISGSRSKTSGRWLKARAGWYAALAGTVLLLLTGGYMPHSVRAWFGNIFNPSMRIDTDASVFVSEYFDSDYEAIDYLNAEVAGQPVVLEAHGDSYTDYERVSVATGLPTVAGWYVHEWLWRQDLTDLNARVADIKAVYSARAEDEAVTRMILEKYDVSYIYVGNLEREQYPDLSDEVLKSLGEVVFDDGVTFIVKV